MRYRDAGLGIEWLPAPSPGAPPAVPMLAGACIAMRRALFESLGGFDTGLMRWGSEDAELSLRLWMAGYELRVVPDVVIAHLFCVRIRTRSTGPGSCTTSYASPSCISTPRASPA